MVVPHHPFPTSRAVTVRELAAFLRMRSREFLPTIRRLVSNHEFPTPIAGTGVFDPIALNNWFARQAGLVAVDNAATAGDGTSDPFLQRERRRIEKTALRSNHQQA
jgi:hypothetical protein